MKLYEYGEWFLIVSHHQTKNKSLNWFLRKDKKPKRVFNDSGYANITCVEKYANNTLVANILFTATPGVWGDKVITIKKNDEKKWEMIIDLLDGTHSSPYSGVVCYFE